MDYHSSMCNLTILQTCNPQQYEKEEQHNVSPTLATLCHVYDAFDGIMFIKDNSPMKFIDDIDTDEEINIQNSQEDYTIERELLEQQQQQQQQQHSIENMTERYTSDSTFDEYINRLLDDKEQNQDNDYASSSSIPLSLGILNRAFVQAILIHD
ncbi:unnamed protein product [Rotaria socialis]|uniref:Uncharacterized protein n=1 Tax=Rotaria socialis TaxID=392032 RepID=A0A820U4V1_9BILA|nr:unnamed protein product [Rotaria socialis]CAF3768481.1 unnamed protein product [Rotaria socialis]CAF4281104.1 unnamed protein product [Rotaria socialis]CAF4477464.1 unnamed protein product [Rotaria socialis]